MSIAYYTISVTPEGRRRYKIHTEPTGGEEIANVLDLQHYQWQIANGRNIAAASRGIKSVVSAKATTVDTMEKEESVFNIADLYPMTPDEKIGQIKTVTANLVISDSSNCAVITGVPGVGKSHSVVEIFNNLDYDLLTCVGEVLAGEEDDAESLINTSSQLVVLITGSITEAALFKVLKQYPAAVIVFDDVSDIFRTQGMVSLLIQATGTDSTRPISWIRAKKSNSIEFRGKMIFITNKSSTDFHPAILSRASGAVVSIDFTKAEMLELLQARAACPHFLRHVSAQAKMDAIEFISTWIAHPQVPTPNLRTLISTAKTFHSESEVAMVCGREPDREFTKRSILMTWLASKK